MAKVLYFNIDDNLDYENSLLEEWGIKDIELIEKKDKEYKKSFLGSVLNNCGVVSQQYGVIRPYNVYIEFEYNDFETR